MEKSRPKIINQIHKVANKILEILSDTLNLYPNLPKAPNSQFQITTYSVPALQKDIEPIFQKAKSQEFFLFLIECIEGCYPILRAKWKFVYEPLSLPNSTKFTSDIETSIILRSLADFLAGTFKSLTGVLKVEISKFLSTRYNWDPSLVSNQIKSFPSQPFTFTCNSGMLSVSIQYNISPLKPRISEKHLGFRPRLKSFDFGEEFKEVNKSFGSHISTEASPQEKRRGNRLLSLIISESFIEEKEIGFSLISSNLDPEPDSGNESFGHNSFDIDSEPQNPNPSDDTQISQYIEQCTLVQNLNIFQVVYNSDKIP